MYKVQKGSGISRAQYGGGRAQNSRGSTRCGTPAPQTSFSSPSPCSNNTYRYSQPKYFWLAISFIQCDTIDLLNNLSNKYYKYFDAVFINHSGTEKYDVLSCLRYMKDDAVCVLGTQNEDAMSFGAYLYSSTLFTRAIHSYTRATLFLTFIDLPFVFVR